MDQKLPATSKQIDALPRGARPSRAILGALLVVIAATVVILLARQREPVYEGKALSEWLEDTNRTYANLRAKPPVPPEFRENAQASEKAARAIRQIGPAALPTIERMLHKDAWLKRKFMELAAKQKLIVFRFVPQDFRRRRAIMACWALGETARPVVPALIECLDDSEYNVRLLAPHALRDMNGEPSLVVPALVKACNDTKAGIK